MFFFYIFSAHLLVSEYIFFPKAIIRAPIYILWPLSLSVVNIINEFDKNILKPPTHHSLLYPFHLDLSSPGKNLKASLIMLKRTKGGQKYSL